MPAALYNKTRHIGKAWCADYKQQWPLQHPFISELAFCIRYAEQVAWCDWHGTNDVHGHHATDL